MRVRPPKRVATSKGPTAIAGINAVDRYLLALDGALDDDAGRLDVLEDEFVEHAKYFALRRGITYAAWRDVGVPQRVLTRAGIVVDAPY